MQQKLTVRDPFEAQLYHLLHLHVICGSAEQNTPSIFFPCNLRERIRRKNFNYSYRDRMSSVSSYDINININLWLRMNGCVVSGTSLSSNWLNPCWCKGFWEAWASSFNSHLPISHLTLLDPGLLCLQSQKPSGFIIACSSPSFFRPRRSVHIWFCVSFLLLMHIIHAHKRLGLRIEAGVFD